MTTSDTARDAAPEMDLADWLVNPPWRQAKSPRVGKSAKGKLDKNLSVLAQALAPQLRWSNALAPVALKRPEAGDESSRCQALGFSLHHLLNAERLPEFDVHLTDFRTTLAEGRDAQAVFQRWEVLNHELGWRPRNDGLRHMTGNAANWLSLGQPGWAAVEPAVSGVAAAFRAGFCPRAWRGRTAGRGRLGQSQFRRSL